MLELEQDHFKPLEPEQVIRFYEETVQAIKDGKTDDFIDLYEYGRLHGLEDN